MNQLLKRKNNELSVKKKKGFTLIELIIVIAIIAVLAAIAIPKFGAVRKDANLRADQANAKIIATAIASAKADGLTPDTGDAVDSENYVKYIEGGVVPKPKTENATKFIVAHDATNDVYTISIDGSNATRVYPIS
jgi:type IV pilus assembly protein PilA